MASRPEQHPPATRRWCSGRRRSPSGSRRGPAPQHPAVPGVGDEEVAGRIERVSPARSDEPRAQHGAHARARGPPPAAAPPAITATSATARRRARVRSAHGAHHAGCGCAGLGRRAIAGRAPTHHDARSPTEKRRLPCPHPKKPSPPGTSRFTGVEGARSTPTRPSLPERPLRRGPGDPPPAGLGLGDQGDHPPLRGQGLQRRLPQPLRPPGARCRPRRRRGRHARGRRDPRRSVRGRRRGAIKALRALPTSNGKVGVIGYCSGGRHSFLTAVSVPVDAAVDCYGAFVTGHSSRGVPAQGDAAGGPDAGAHLPAARPLRQRGPVPQPRAGGRAGGGAAGGRQDLRVPPLRRRGPRLLLGGPAGLPARGRGRRLAADFEWYGRYLAGG